MPGRDAERSLREGAAFLTVPENDDRKSHAQRRVWRRLSPLERAILATDGSFTLLLTALHGEAITPELIDQRQQRLTQANQALQLEKNDMLLKRRVLLKTATTQRPVTYAESLIVPSRLSPAMRRDLLAGSWPIGLLLRRESLETHRVMLDWGKCPPSPAAKDVFGAQSLLFRTYSIIARALPIMTVSEYFPFMKQKGVSAV